MKIKFQEIKQGDCFSLARDVEDIYAINICLSRVKAGLKVLVIDQFQGNRVEIMDTKMYGGNKDFNLFNLTKKGFTRKV